MAKKLARKSKASSTEPNILELTTRKDTSPYVFQKDRINYDLHFRDFPWTEKQKNIIELLTHKDTRIVFISGPAGTSKAQPLTAKILTPNGWCNMGDLKVGDYVISVNGEPTKVLSIHPQGMKDIYKVNFNDDSSTECCEDHLWAVKNENQRNYYKKINGKNIKSDHDWDILPLKELRNNISPRNRLNYSIPIVKPIKFEKKEVVIHPYIMGALLGDGGLSRKNRCVFTSNDPDILEKISKNLPASNVLSKQSRYDYIIKGEGRGIHSNNSVLLELKKLNLLGKYAYNKYIPEEYLYNDIESRIQLLRGLMDTYGHVSNEGYSSVFTTTSKQLKDDLTFLVRSLGGITKCSEHENFYTYLGEKKRGRNSFCLHICLPPDINPFYLPRKNRKVIPKTKYKPVRYITSVDYCGKKECQCILIEDDTHLYITDDFIVTHNTILATYAALKLLNDKRISEVIYVRSIIESASKGLGSLPGEADTKFAPFIMPLLDKMQELLKNGDTTKLLEDERVKPIPINFLRGASFNANIVIADEMQNADFSEIQTIITRIGKFSKFIFVGDPMQSDLREKHRSGFKPMFDIFNNQESKERGIFCVELGVEDIMRSEILKYIVEKLEIYKSQLPISGDIKNINAPNIISDEKSTMFPDD